MVKEEVSDGDTDIATLSHTGGEPVRLQEEVIPTSWGSDDVRVRDRDRTITYCRNPKIGPLPESTRSSPRP